VLRRSRGYVPRSIELGSQFPPVLGVGAESKNSLCLIKNNNAFSSQHIGDLTNYRAYQFFRESVDHLERITQQKAEFIACDLHSDYLSTQWAHEQNELPVFMIQHHHAHMAACMAEHQIDEKAIAVIFDGSGLGYDGAIWGGDFFVGDYLNLKRIAHFEYMPLPGGDAAIREPWRAATGYLYSAFGEELPELPSFGADLPVMKIMQILAQKINSPLTSSAGRLFDAVSALAGGPARISYEAQAAITLMHAIQSTNFESYRIDINRIDDKYIISVKSLIQQVYEDVMNGVDYSQIAGKFHLTLAEMITQIVATARESYKLNKVILSGGVFQNEILLTLTETNLRKNNFNVYTPVNIPINDGGISLGQAIICGHLLKNNLSYPSITI